MGGVKSLFSSGGAEEEQKQLATEPFEGFRVQRFLPPSLRSANTTDTLRTGVQGIGELIRNPGGLSPTVSDAIRPRLAAESENIAGNFRNFQAENTGAAARSNTPVSLKDAVSRAINVAQERAQRGARRDALSDSDNLRRQDLSQTFSLLDAILQFIGSGRGQAVQGLGAAGGLEQNRKAANLSAIGSLSGNLGDLTGSGVLGLLG